MKKPTINLSPDALFQLIGGEGVILDLATSTYFGLDPVGARFWELLQTDTDVEACCEQLLLEYEVSRETLERDIDALLTELESAGLVTLA